MASRLIHFGKETSRWPEKSASRLACVTQTAVSNDEGNYVVPFLMPGRYTVAAELPGFERIYGFLKT